VYGSGSAQGGPPRIDAPPDPRIPRQSRTPSQPRRPQPRAPKKRRRSGVLVVLAVALILGGGGLATIKLLSRGSAAVPTPASGSPAISASPTASPTPTLAPLRFAAATVALPDIGAHGFLSWALMDRRTGDVWGSSNMSTETTFTASMIKGWLAADYLRLKYEAGKTPTSSQLNTVEIMIRDSDNNAAATIYSAVGGRASIKRLASICKATTAKAGSGFGYTQVSALDTVRMADCIADGTAAGPKWTPWLLDKMRGVRGAGDFGIRKALAPDEAAQVAIKNGWDFFAGTPDDADHDDDLYHVNCMAVSDTWAMAVLLRFADATYPSSGNFQTNVNRGAQYCQSVATQLLNPAAT
jgi:hypothetical protein